MRQNRQRREFRPRMRCQCTKDSVYCICKLIRAVHLSFTLHSLCDSRRRACSLHIHVVQNCRSVYCCRYTCTNSMKTSLSLDSSHVLLDVLSHGLRLAFIFCQHFSFISEAVTHAVYPPLKDLRTMHSFINNHSNALLYTTLLFPPQFCVILLQKQNKIVDKKRFSFICNWNLQNLFVQRIPCKRGCIFVCVY